MALFTHWSSKARRGHIAALSPMAAEPVSTEEAEALFAAWEASGDKSAFITGVSLVQASALCDLIARRVPPTYAGPRRELVERPVAPEDAAKRRGGISQPGRRARRVRIAGLVGLAPDSTTVRDVYTALNYRYGGCPPPRLITAEMVAEALAHLGRKAGQ